MSRFAWIQVWILAVGVLATGVMILVVRDASGVYVATVRVTVVAPPDPDVPNRYANGTVAAVAVAGVVALVVDPEGRQQFAAPDITLVNSGVRHGHWVRLPDSGGQWASAFVDPWLDIQVVDTDPARAQMTAERLVAKVQHTLESIQNESRTDPKNRFTIELVPKSGPELTYMRGRSNPATAMTLILGAGLTIVLLSWNSGRMQAALREDS